MANENMYGPLQRLLDNPDITEVMVNGPKNIFVEFNGTKVLTDVSFENEAEVMALVNKLYASRGKRVGADIPYADVCLEDGTRINVIIPPVSRLGVTVTFRKFSKHIQSIDDLIRLDTINKPALDFLITCIKNRINMIISGGTGAGKTTILQLLAHYFDPHDRVITIEDAAELRLSNANVVSLETKPPEPDGSGGVTLRDLIRNALRMTPDRLIIGEVRSDEAIDMIQAMATGHSGTLGILHGNSPAEILSRLETMILMSGVTLPLLDIRKLIATTIHLIVHCERLPNGARKVTRISMIEGIQAEKVFLTDVFDYRFTKKGPDGKDIYGLTQLVPLMSISSGRG